MKRGGEEQSDGRQEWGLRRGRELLFKVWGKWDGGGQEAREAGRAERESDRIPRPRQASPLSL